MADPKVRVRFESYAGENNAVQEVGLINALNGEFERVTFTDGVFETSEPGLIPPLRQLAATAGHPIKEAVEIKPEPRKGK